MLLQFSLNEIEKKYGTAASVAVFFAIMILFTVILITLVMFAGRAAHRRRKIKRAAWGRKYGLELQDTLEMGKRLFAHLDTEVGEKVLADYPYVSLFRTNTTARAMYILEGTVDGRQTRVFEYQYITGSGRTTVEHRHTVVAVEFDGIKGYTALRRHGWGDKLSKDDIKTGVEVFDKEFYIYADEWGLLRNEMPQELAQMLMDSILKDLVLAEKRLVIVATGRVKDDDYDKLLADGRRLGEWIGSKY